MQAIRMLTRQGCASRGGADLQRGVSLVELLVGITVGLFVVAAAAMLVGSQLSENRNLLLETQMQQDLRSTADIMTRELRRIGFADSVLVWNDGMSGPVAETSVASITPASGSSITEIDFFYRRRPGDDTRFGFKLEDGVIKTKVYGCVGGPDRRARDAGHGVQHQHAGSHRVPASVRQAVQ
jgi:type II secretory pathway component PulJ